MYLDVVGESTGADWTRRSSTTVDPSATEVGTGEPHVRTEISGLRASRLIVDDLGREGNPPDCATAPGASVSNGIACVLLSSVHSTIKALSAASTSLISAVWSENEPSRSLRHFTNLSVPEEVPFGV
jgi:hypothetical protein